MEVTEDEDRGRRVTALVFQNHGILERERRASNLFRSRLL